jgi:hypothetical protein
MRGKNSTAAPALAWNLTLPVTALSFSCKSLIGKGFFLLKD